LKNDPFQHGKIWIRPVRWGALFPFDEDLKPLRPPGRPEAGKQNPRTQDTVQEMNVFPYEVRASFCLKKQQEFSLLFPGLIHLN